MQYPLISEYIDAICNAEDNFDKLNNLRPVLDEGGNPIMSSGNFAVVFKMTDGEKDYAVKCFTREQEGREESYKIICAWLNDIKSSYFVHCSYYEAELFVDTGQTDNDEFPVVLMEWADGLTLDKYIDKFQGNSFALYELCHNFRCMARWLVSQSFAHGDIKPDNILVRKDGSIVLIDYDGMYIDSMRNEVQREDGSPNYRSPFFITEFNAHMDDFALAILSLSLKLISASFNIRKEHPTKGDGLLISRDDVLNINQSDIFSYIMTLLPSEPNLSFYYATFIKCLGGYPLDTSDFTILEGSIDEFIRSNESIDSKIKRGIVDSNGVIYTKDGTRVIGIKSDQLPSNREIFIKEGVIFFDENSINYDTPKLKIHLPSTLRYFSAKSFNYRYLSLNWSSPWFTYSDGIIYTKDKTEAILINSYDAKFNINTLIFGNSLFEGLKFDGIWPNSIQRIRSRVFECATVPDVFAVPEGVISMGKRACAYCSAKIVLLPKSLNNMGVECFSCCVNLERVEFAADSSMNYIPECAFELNHSLHEVKFPRRLKRVGSRAFSRCGKITDLLFPSSLEEIDSAAFCMMESDRGNGIESELKELVLPASLRIIGEAAFCGYDKFSTVTFSSYIERIEKDTFANCSKLTTLNHQGIQYIGENAFGNCNIVFKSLEKIEEIEPGALNGCEIISTGNPLFSIKRDCLYSETDKRLIYCWSRESIIEIDEGVRSLDMSLFLNTPVALILPNSYLEDNLSNIRYVPVLVVPRHIAVEKYYGFSDIQKVIHERVFIDSNGVVYSADKKSLILFRHDLESEIYEVLMGCEIIERNAFELDIDADPEFGVSYHGNMLKDIILPQSLRVIEYGAFSGCQEITSIRIPDGVSEIGSEAFKYCTSLAEITLPSSLEDLGESAFEPSVRVIIPQNSSLRYEGKCLLSRDNELLWIPKGIDALSLPEIVSYHDKKCHTYDNCLVTIDGELIWTIPNIPNFEFPSSVVRIGREAFYGNEVIKELVIPEGITSIDYDAFGCNKALKDIYVPSTMKYIGSLKTFYCWGEKYIKDCYSARIHIPKGMRHYFKELLPGIPDSMLLEYE